MVPAQYEQIRHYAEVKKRLYGLRARVVIRPQPAPVEPVRPDPKRYLRLTEAQRAARIRDALNTLIDLSADAPVKPQLHLGHAQRIIRETAAQYGVSPDEITGPRRQLHLIIPRHHAIWRVRNECPHLSYPQIGRIFGGRDHTSIINAVRRHDERVTNGQLRP